jgi:uncharacterized protein YwqG
MRKFFGFGGKGDGPTPRPGIWTRAELEARLLAAAPSAGPALVSRLRPAIRLVAVPTPDHKIPVGVSKFGGAPDLPRGFEWPIWRNQQGEVRPLGFYAQIALADMNNVAQAALNLGDGGLLSFFCDYAFDGLNGIMGLMPWEQAGSRIARSAASQLARHSSRGQVWPSAAFIPVPIWTWPQEIEGVEVPDSEFDALDALTRDYESVILAGRQSGQHQLGGHASFIQHPVEEEVVQALYVNDDHGQFVRERWETAKSKVAEWRLVLQIDSDDGLDVMWGDVGMLYWAARQKDIDQDNWSNAMFNFQCS